MTGGKRATRVHRSVAIILRLFARTLSLHARGYSLAIFSFFLTKHCARSAGDDVAKVLPPEGLLSGLLWSPPLSFSMSRSKRILSGWDGRIHVPWDGIMRMPSAAWRGIVTQLAGAARLGGLLARGLGSGGSAVGCIAVGWALFRMLHGDFDHLMVLH